MFYTFNNQNPLEGNVHVHLETFRSALGVHFGVRGSDGIQHTICVVTRAGSIYVPVASQGNSYAMDVSECSLGTILSDTENRG